MTFRNSKRFQHQKELFVAAEGTYTGQFLYCGKKAQLVVGNVLPVGNMPGLHHLQRRGEAGRPRCAAKASGEYCILISHNPDTGFSRIKLLGVEEDHLGLPRDCWPDCGGRRDKPMLKAGANYHKFKVAWCHVAQGPGVAMNPWSTPRWW